MVSEQIRQQIFQKVIFMTRDTELECLDELDQLADMIRNMNTNEQIDDELTEWLFVIIRNMNANKGYENEVIEQYHREIMEQTVRMVMTRLQRVISEQNQNEQIDQKVLKSLVQILNCILDPKCLYYKHSNGVGVFGESKSEITPYSVNDRVLVLQDGKWVEGLVKQKQSTMIWVEYQDDYIENSG